MPARRRRRPGGGQSPAPDPADPVAQFGRLLRRQAEQERAAHAAERERVAHERQLADARAEVDAAIAAVKSAATPSQRADADRAWALAKARLLELEEGVRPDWSILGEHDEPGQAGEPGQHGQHGEPGERRGRDRDGEHDERSGA